MLNRIRTTKTKTNRKTQVDNKKLCSQSMTSSRKSPTLLSLFNHHTDAILTETYNIILVSQLQKSRLISTDILPTISPVASLQRSTIKATVPYSSSSGSESSFILQRRPKPFNSSSIIIKSSAHKNQQITVNSKAYKSIDNHCSRKQGYPKTKAHKMMNDHIYYLSALFMTLCCTLSIASQFAAAAADGSLQSVLQKMRIHPDTIEVDDSTQVIKVELHGNIVKPGDPIPARHFKDLSMGKIFWDPYDLTKSHTLMLLDLDRKPGSNVTQNIYNQYTSLNIPGNIINQGQTIVALDTPIVPCQPSAKHRILMLVFQQDQNIDISDAVNISAASGHSQKRENFKLSEFIQRHRLSLLAANAFFAMGEANGVCSGSITIHSLQSISTVLIAMVIAVTAFALTSKRSMFN